MADPTSPSQWPWRKWFLAGALSGVATTILGPVAVGACGGSVVEGPQDACASFDACAQPCAASADACVLVLDAQPDVVEHEEAGTESGAEDAPFEASDGGKSVG